LISAGGSVKPHGFTQAQLNSPAGYSLPAGELLRNSQKVLKNNFQGRFIPNSALTNSGSCALISFKPILTHPDELVSLIDKVLDGYYGRFKICRHYTRKAV
jgi:hypothetical protein